MSTLRSQIIRLAHTHPDLQPHLLPLLKTGSSWVTVGGSARRLHLEAVWEMYQTTYKVIGLHLPNPQALLKYDAWQLYLDQGVPIAFSLFEPTPFGFKLGIGGSDGTTEGKTRIVSLTKMLFKRPGFYGELSHKLKDIALSAGASAVCNAYAAKILGKAVEPLDDGVSYVRTLANVGRVVKVLIGLPKGIPVTDYNNPQCPILDPGRMASTNIEDEDINSFLAHQACLVF